MEILIPVEDAVFILEDSEERIAWFRQRLPNAVFAKTAQQAIMLLSQRSFGMIFLDHDLGFLDAADPTRLHYNGKEVSRYLAIHHFAGCVVIHSRNPVGAEAMKKVLPKAHLLPYGTFEVGQ